MTNNNAIITNSDRIRNLTADNVTINVDRQNVVDNVVAVEVICNVTLTTPTAEDDKKEFADLVKKLATKKVREDHNKYYYNKPMQAIANREYKLSSSDFKEQSIFVPVVGTLNPDIKKLYREKVVYLQKFGIEWVNNADDSKKQDVFFTNIKDAMRDIFAAFDPKTAFKCKDKDVRLFLTTLGKIRGNAYTTTGDRVVMAAIEYVIYHKIYSKEFYMDLYSLNKKWDKLTIKQAEKPAKEEPAKEEKEAA